MTDIRAEDGALQLTVHLSITSRLRKFAEGKANGYGKWKVFWLKRKEEIKIPATQKTLQDFFLFVRKGFFNLEFLYPSLVTRA